MAYSRSLDMHVQPSPRTGNYTEGSPSSVAKVELFGCRLLNDTNFFTSCSTFYLIPHFPVPQANMMYEKDTEKFWWGTDACSETVDSIALEHFFVQSGKVQFCGRDHIQGRITCLCISIALDSLQLIFTDCMDERVWNFLYNSYICTCLHKDLAKWIFGLKYIIEIVW